MATAAVEEKDENLSEEEKNLNPEVGEEKEVEGEEEVTDETEEGEAEPSEEEKEQSFMNPNELPKELLPSFKAMQRSFTRAMQRISSDRDKVAMYDQLMTDPQRAVEMLAQKVGVQIQKPVNQETGSEVGDSETTRWIRQIVQETLKPVVAELKGDQAQVKAQSAIAYLEKTYPDWYLYEDIMAELVKKHPSLRDDLDNLYTLSKSGADKAITMKRAATKTKQVITQTSKGRGGVVVPTKATTVQEAFEIAKKQLGIKD